MFKQLQKKLKSAVRKSNHFVMSERSIKLGNYICIKNTSRILDTAYLVLNNSKNLDHALGLYTFALEEFGKAVWLKECWVKNKHRQYVPKSIFRLHNKKFKKALKNLPDECKIIPVGEYVNFPSGKTSTLGLKIKKQKLTIPKGLTGTFLTDIIMNFDVRMRCFYVDWDENSNYWHRWKLNLQTDRKSLKKGIEKFGEVLPKHNILELISKKKI